MEEWLDNKIESAKEGWLQEKTSNEIWEVLDGEGSIQQMISDIDNEKIRNILEYFYNRKDNSLQSQRLKEEVALYYDELEPKLKDKELNELFNRLTNTRKLLPSSILKEFQIRDEILAESDPLIKNLMVILLKKATPSTILPSFETEREKSREIYRELATVTNPDEKEIIQRYLDEWYSPKLIKEEYEDYVYIKNYGYKNEDLKNYILSVINDKKENPSLIMFFFDIFKDWTEFWEDGRNYIIWLINSHWL